MAKQKVMTELETLKKKCLGKDGSPKTNAESRDLVRLKQLQDGEPLSKAELEEAQKREAEKKQKDIDDYQKEHTPKPKDPAATAATPDPELNQPAEHPRITSIKQALMPFTQLEVNETRPDEFILINRGVAITAGDVRTARRAMKL